MMKKHSRPMFQDNAHVWYSPKRDGDLNTYLGSRDGHASTYVFNGFKHYQMLWNLGYFVPGRSGLRVMWNNVIDDEVFTVRSLHELEGFDSNVFHKAGLHNPRKVLKQCPLFEAHELETDNPRPRFSEKKKH